jgi:hemerythrin superfamily protein
MLHSAEDTDDSMRILYKHVLRVDLSNYQQTHDITLQHFIIYLENDSFLNINFF